MGSGQLIYNDVVDVMVQFKSGRDLAESKISRWAAFEKARRLQFC